MGNRLQFTFMDILSKDQFYPLTHIREIEDLVVGAFSLKERILFFAPQGTQYISLLGQEALDFSSLVIFSSTVILTPNCIQKIFDKHLEYQDTIWITEDSGEFIACSISITLLKENSDLLSFLRGNNSLIPKKTVPQSEILCQIPHLGALLETHESILNNDLLYLLAKQTPRSQETFTVQGNQKDLYVSATANIAPYVVFNTQKGPIYIEEEANIGAFSYIEGPCIIKQKSTLQRAFIACSYIGEGCKIGGEVSSSIFLSYSNKAHEGYVGNSYIGTFVNLGALSTTSNLKNNYHTVSLEYLSKSIQTESLKLGALIGDFTTIGIGVILNTGTSIGVSCNLVHESGFLPRNIPSFTWVSVDTGKKYRWNEMIETLNYRMSRRNQVLSDKQVKKLKILYEGTQ